MRIQKSRMRCVGIFLAVVICFFAVQQSYGVQNMHDITQAEPDHLAVHTMERQQGSFLDILGRSELTQSEQARLTVSARITRLNAERNVILWPPCIDSVTQRKKFIFIILYLFSPSSLAGGKMTAGLREEMSKVLGIQSKSTISDNCADVVFLYQNYGDFSGDIEYLYTEIVNRLKFKGLIN